MIHVVKLPPIIPVVVSRGDPNWLKELFAHQPYCLSAIDLTASEDRWPNIANWPEFDDARRARKYGIAWFEDEPLSDFPAMDARLTQEGFGPEKRTFLPDLAYQVVPRMDWIWELRRKLGKGPIWVHTSSTDSVWCDGGGSLCVPCVGVGPGDRKVGAGWFESGLSDGGGFLVSCE